MEAMSCISIGCITIRRGWPCMPLAIELQIVDYTEVSPSSVFGESMIRHVAFGSETCLCIRNASFALVWWACSSVGTFVPRG